MNGLFKQIEDSDIFILDILNNSIKCKPFDWIMPKITYMGSTEFAVSACILLFIYPNYYVHLFSIKFILSLIASTVMVWLIKLCFNRPRPFLKIENLNVRKISIDNYSFPSAHSAAAFSMAVTGNMFFHQFGIIFLILASFVAISRIYIGVHYPTDVFIGILIGITCSMSMYYIY